MREGFKVRELQREYYGGGGEGLSESPVTVPSHLVSVHHELVHQVRTDEARAAGHQDPFPVLVGPKEGQENWARKKEKLPTGSV
jgi:hypothetical protein